jgi:hypothetical protein
MVPRCRGAERGKRMGSVIVGTAKAEDSGDAHTSRLATHRPSYLISIGTLVAVKIPLAVALGRTGEGAGGLGWRCRSGRRCRRSLRW